MELVEPSPPSKRLQHLLGDGDGRAEINMQGRGGLGEFWCRWKAPESGEGVLPPPPALPPLSPPSAPTGGGPAHLPLQSRASPQSQSQFQRGRNLCFERQLPKCLRFP